MAFFDFNVGTSLPNGLVEYEENSSTLFEGKLKATSENTLLYEDSTTPNANGSIELTVKIGGNALNASTGATFRQSDEGNYLFAGINKDGNLRLLKFQNGSASVIGAQYAIPSFSPNNEYTFKVSFFGDLISVGYDGEVRVSVTEEFNQTVSRSGLRIGDVKNEIDNVSFFDADGNLTEVAAVGSAPVISDTGNQTEIVYVGEGIPAYTITASDAEDGDLTSSIYDDGSVIDPNSVGQQSITYYVQDSDLNITSYTKTFNVVTRPVISFPADIRNPMELKVGQTFVLPTARFHDPDNFAYGEVTGQGWSGTGSAGTQTVTYNYTNPDGSEALEVALEINVVEVTTITSTYPFTMLQEYAGETVTIDGYELTYFENSDGSSFGYGFADEQRVESSGTKAATNDTFAPQEVAMIKLPFDSAAMAEKIRVYVEVEMSGPVDGTEIQLGFSKIRNAEKYRMRRYFGSETKAILEFDMIPFDSDHFRIGFVGNGNDPDKMIVDDNPYFNTALSTEVFIPIHVKFGNTDGGVTLTKVDAYAIVGPAKFNKNGSFLNGRDRVDIIPFAENDPLNLPLPSNLVVREPVMTYNRDVQNFDHFEATAGSDYVTVGQTDGVRVGDLIAVFRQTHSVIASDPSFESEGARVGAIQVAKTLEIFGKDVKVKAVVDGTTLQLSRPALINYKSTDDGVDYLKRFYGLVTLTAENASILIGQDNDSWDTSLITGKSYPGNKATAYNGMKQVYYCKSTDPIERFNYSRLVTPNNWIFPIPDDADTTTAYGEAIIDGWFEMPTPVEYDGTFNSANNADRNVIFITPDKRYAISVYLANPQNGDGHYTCGRVSCWDMSQYSIPDILFKENLKDSGESASTRASSISMAAGFIRKEEADLIQYSGYDTDEKIDADMAVARNAIKHAITYVPASPVLQSLNYMNDLGLQVSYFSHESYVIEPIISDAGTGYAVGDVCYLGCDDLVDTVEATRFVVQAVGDNGEILKVFTTHTGQHKINCGKPNHAPYETSGNGTGATFDTSSYISQSTTPLKSAAYPATIVDGNNAQTGLYAGSNPMGGVCTIRPSLDIHNAFKAKLKARIATSGEPQYSDSYEFYAVLCAIEKYGLIPCDTSTGTSVMFAIDARMTEQQKDSFFNNASAVYRNAIALRNYLVPVDNYTPTHALAPEDILPVLKLDGDDNLDVTSEWSDTGAHSYTRLYGDKTVTANPPFSPQIAGAQTLSYQYTDRSGSTSNVVQRSVNNVDASTGNVPPTANAGPDQSVAAATQFMLDGTGSQDTDGTIVEWRWTQTEGDPVTLNLEDPARPTATSPSKTTSQRLTFQLITVDDEGAESSPGTVNIDVAAFAVSEMLKLLDTRTWEVENDGSVQAFEGRSNREAFRFKVTPSDGIQTSAEGYFLFDQPGVHAVEVISTPTSKISSIDDPHMIRGDVIAARIGDLQTDENGNLILTFVLYVTDDKDGLVMTAKVIEPYQKASYFRKQG